MDDDEHAAREAAHVGTGCQGDFNQGWDAGAAYGHEKAARLQERRPAHISTIVGASVTLGSSEVASTAPTGDAYVDGGESQLAAGIERMMEGHIVPGSVSVSSCSVDEYVPPEDKPAMRSQLPPYYTLLVVEAEDWPGDAYRAKFKVPHERDEHRTKAEAIASAWRHFDAVGASVSSRPSDDRFEAPDGLCLEQNGDADEPGDRWWVELLTNDEGRYATWWEARDAAWAFVDLCRSPGNTFKEELAQANHRADRRYAGIEELTRLVEQVKAAHQAAKSRLCAAIGIIEERRKASNRTVEYPWPGSVLSRVYAALVPCMARDCALEDGHEGSCSPSHPIHEGYAAPSGDKAKPTAAAATSSPKPDARTTSG